MFVLLAGTTWILQKDSDNSDGSSGNISMFAGGIDYYLSDVTFRNLAADGRPLYELHAQDARHRQADDVIEMSDIKFAYFPDQESSENHTDAWLLQAGSGEVNSDQSRVLLDHNVVARREHAELSAEIHTSAMLIEPHKNILISLAPVLIQQGAHTVRAQSMTVELDSSRVILSDGVKGRYVP